MLHLGSFPLLLRKTLSTDYTNPSHPPTVLLDQLHQRERAVLPRWFQIVLPVRGDQKLCEAGILVCEIVFLLQLYTIHLFSHFLEELRRGRKADEMNSRKRSRVHRATGIEFERIFHCIEVLPEEDDGALG